MPARRRRIAAAALALTCLVAACGADQPPAADRATTSTTAADGTTPGGTPATPSAPAPPPPPTVPAPPTTLPAPEPPPAPPTTVPEAPVLRVGSRGPEVAALQGRLGELGYWLGDTPGTFGATTAQAVMAFQKVEGLGRDGVAGPITVEHLAGATRPRPRGVDVAGRSVEIDLDRQVVLLVEGGEATTVLNTSTGRSGMRTPQGRFTVTREIDGIRKAPLGDLYRPKYFHKGIALHGSPSIPAQPASHGCARLHDDAMDLLWSDDLVPVGTPVWVYAA